MLLVSLFIPLLTSFYIGLFGRFDRFGIWFSIGTFNIYWTFNFIKKTQKMKTIKKNKTKINGIVISFRTCFY